MSQGQDGTEILLKLFPMEIDKSLIEKVKANKWLYPNVGKFNTAKKIDARKVKVSELYKKAKPGKRRDRYRNEWTILVGKEASIRLGGASAMASMLTMSHRLHEWDIYGGRHKKTDEDKEHQLERDILMAATYFHAGMAVKAHKTSSPDVANEPQT
jgi:hypothetical protein